MKETEVKQVFIGELFYCNQSSAFYRRIAKPAGATSKVDYVWAETAKDKEVFPFPPDYRVVV